MWGKYPQVWAQDGSLCSVSIVARRCIRPCCWSCKKCEGEEKRNLKPLNLAYLQSLAYERVLEIHSQHLAPMSTAYFPKPLLLHQGHMEWLFDYEGNRYLDFFSGIVTVSVGHCHPWVSLKFRHFHSWRIYGDPASDHVGDSELWLQIVSP